MNSRKVAYLCLEVLQENRAAFRHVYGIVDGLKRLGWHVEIFAPKRESISKRTQLIHILDLVWAQIRLLSRVRSFDVVYIRGHPLALPVTVLCRLFGKSTIDEVNGTELEVFQVHPISSKVGLREFVSLAIWARIRLSVGVVAVTKQLASWARLRCGAKRVAVIPNGVDPNVFRPRKKTHDNHIQKYAVFIGNLAPWQSIDDLLHAAELPEWPKNISLVIAGDGLLRDMVIDAEKKNPIVKFLGAISINDAIDLLASAFVSLCTQGIADGRSAYGINPLKVYESLACGTPVIVTDFPGQSDLIRENHCGLVVPPGSPIEIARAVKYLLDNNMIYRRMSKNCRKTILRNHSWQKRAEDTSRFIEDILE